ncbi:MAG: hypothetical protein KC800_16400 [Candidatus Eremiobacteraeota bacterium]|nr:hypothetical protein [Candidatus Eremiobacteraeota bacterium]
MNRVHDLSESAPKELRIFEMLPKIEDYIDAINDGMEGLRTLVESYQFNSCLSSNDFLSVDQESRCRSGVYFISPDGIDAVKIGMTSSGLKGRKSDLQVSNPFTLRTLLFLSTDQPRWWEGVIQSMFSKYRIHGEWYVRSKTMPKFTTNGSFVSAMMERASIFREIEERYTNKVFDDVKLITPKPRPGKPRRKIASLRRYQVAKVWESEEDSPRACEGGC